VAPFRERESLSIFITGRDIARQGKKKQFSATGGGGKGGPTNKQCGSDKGESATLSRRPNIGETNTRREKGKASEPPFNLKYSLQKGTKYAYLQRNSSPQEREMSRERGGDRNGFTFGRPMPHGTGKGGRPHALSNNIEGTGTLTTECESYSQRKEEGNRLAFSRGNRDNI